MDEDFDIRQEQISASEKDYENALRPLSFDDFSGQKQVVENLRVFVEAAKYRGEPLDHTLLHGPPGLGKTTLSNIIANELGVGFKITSGPVLDKPGDLAGILTSLEKNDVLFIDEIHRLSPVVEEYLYSAMEDYRIDIMIDKGPSARSIQIDLNPFTLVGATTRSGLLTAPLRARFGINMHLQYYQPETLQRIITRSASILGVPITAEAAAEIAGRSRGTPRIANALLRRVRDFAQVRGTGRIDTNITQVALTALNIDQYGLDEIDNRLLLTIIDKLKGDRWASRPLLRLSEKMQELWRKSMSHSSSWRVSSSEHHEEEWSPNWLTSTLDATPIRETSWNQDSLTNKNYENRNICGKLRPLYHRTRQHRQTKCGTI